MKQHKIFAGSSYDRYLDLLLFIWPDVLKKYPDAELHIAYGWNLFVTGFHTNPERMAWKQSVDDMMQQDGIFHYGRVGKAELDKIRQQCGIWAYPTYFDEINCITALESQKDGLVPVTMKKGALVETVGSGVLVDGDIKALEVQEKYTEALLDMMGDTKKWQRESEKAKKFAESYTWQKIAQKWVDIFEKEEKNPLVSIITCTNREGWWESMARNLSHQTYKNFEWLIIDDHKEDRSALAEKMAKDYRLQIRYIRGDKAKRTYKRKYGLVRANNIGMKESKGKLLVYLQDFMYPQQNGIEMLVNVYIDNPTAFIAPIDDYWYANEPMKESVDDWWPNQMIITSTHAWRNVRQKHEGLRDTNNPYDFEMNYGAIPKTTLEALGGWYEFFDDQLGYDNTQIAYRGLQAGYRIIIDDTNVAIGLEMEGENARKTADPELWDRFIKDEHPVIRVNKKS